MRSNVQYQNAIIFLLFLNVGIDLRYLDLPFVIHQDLPTVHTHYNIFNEGNAAPLNVSTSYVKIFQILLQEIKLYSRDCISLLTHLVPMSKKIIT